MSQATSFSLSPLVTFHTPTRPRIQAFFRDNVKQEQVYSCGNYFVHVCKHLDRTGRLEWKVAIVAELPLVSSTNAAPQLSEAPFAGK